MEKFGMLKEKEEKDETDDIYSNPIFKSIALDIEEDRKKEVEIALKKIEEERKKEEEEKMKKAA